MPLGLNVNRLAKGPGIGAARLNEPYFWPATSEPVPNSHNVRRLYDSRMAERKARATIEREVTPLKVA